MAYVRHIEVAIDIAFPQDYDGAGRVVASTLEPRLERAMRAFVKELGHVGQSAESVRYRTTYGYRTYSKVKKMVLQR